MRFAVSIISPPGYIHSEAFREVAETLHYALLDLGHDSTLTSEARLPGRQHIVLGSNLLPGYPIDLAPGAILYNLEQITPNSPWLNPDLLHVFKRYPLWDYSQENIAQLARLGIPGVERLPIGYVPQLTRIFPADEDIDVLFIGSVNERRRAILEALRRRGMRVETGFGVYGEERDRLIARAKIVLNVHYYDSKVFEVVRCSYLLANGRFVISERGRDSEEDKSFDQGLVFAAYDELVRTCDDFLSRPEARANRAIAGLELMGRRPQTAFLAPLIEKLASAQRVGSVVAPRPDVDVEEDAPTRAEQAEESSQPRVSIVLLAYNKAELTMSCLTSLVETTEDSSVDLELIVVDNGSTDDTPALLANLVEGDVTVLRNDINVGFGEACNQGAAIARGDYVLFLSNDTVLLPGWLPPLVAALDEDPRRGAVQPRLIYPDGRLNDAGGLVFQGGEAWNYGKGARVLDAPLYATRRAPDYICGACMLVRRSAFIAVGGFDPRYAPAYCEDTDLSFALRAAGWTLLYEPASTVVHLEGGTNGTDVTVGLKRFQVINKEKLARKWEADLRRRPRMDPSIVDAWAHRGQGGYGPGEDPALAEIEDVSRSVMYIDPFPPMWDRASGCLRIMQLLRSWRRDGHGVVHVAAGAAPERRRYAAELARFGVPLYGLDPKELPDDPEALAVMRASYLPDLAIILRRHRPDVVVLSLWSTAEPLIDGVRAILPDAMIVVDSHDVHFLRERRAAELAGDALLARRAEDTRTRELAVYAKADRVVCVSERDADVVRQAIPDRDVVVAGNAYADVDPGPGFSSRKGLLFVGNVNHTPNLDAVRWWREEIAPRLARRLPGVRLTVIGNDPAGALHALKNKNVDVLGWVPDTLPYLHAARVSVAPLRFGAGIKGKIGEALTAGLPVVGTPIAVEGMDLRDGHNVLVGENADEFVAQVARAYTAQALWEQLREQGLEHARAEMGVAAMRTPFAAIVAPRECGARALRAV